MQTREGDPRYRLCKYQILRPFGERLHKHGRLMFLLWSVMGVALVIMGIKPESRSMSR